VSNHGGRQLDQGVGSIDVFAEVVGAVGGQARVIVDGGVSRGTEDQICELVERGVDVIRAAVLVI
jgi:hypothetical protein